MVRTSQRKLNQSGHNVSAPVAIRGQLESCLGLRVGMALLTAAALAACAPQPAPRTVFDFMEDGLARDGVLTRCNQDRDATLTDTECANARRAAAAIALEAERGREAELDHASDVKLAALRESQDRQSPVEPGLAADAVAAFGAPVGAVLPSMSQAFDVYADGSEPLGRRNLEVEAVEPPANNLEIASPQLVLTDLAIPRPFRANETTQQ
jgi:hypothetical protein